MASIPIAFSHPELLKIHKRYAHPTEQKLSELLKKAAPDKYQYSSMKFLDDVVKHFESCQRMAPRSFVFQEIMPDNIQFNCQVLPDLT